MIPDDACDVLSSSCEEVAKVLESKQVSEWEVFATQAWGMQVEIENDCLNLAGGGGEGGIGIRVVDSGAFGFSYLADASKANQAVDDAIKVARMSPRVEGFSLPTDSGSSRVDGLFDAGVCNLTPDDLMSDCDLIISQAKDIDQRISLLSGGISNSATASAILTSNGIEDSGKTSCHSVSLQSAIDEDDQLTSSWEGKSSRSLIKDFDSLIEKAVHWTTITRNPLPDGQDAVDSPVLMTGDGFSPLFSMVVPNALTGERLARSESLWSGKHGKLVMADHLSVIDDRCMEGGMSSSGRDGEGLATTRRELVSGGKMIDSIWSTRDAAKQVADGNVDEAVSTASASRGSHHSPPSVGCGDLSLVSSSRTHSRDELIEIMEEGYIVHSVMGAHTANPTSGDFSVTTSSILRVEGGEVIGSVRQAGLSGNMASALAGKVILGNDVHVKGSYTSGTMHLTDAVLFEGLRVNPL